MISMADTSQIHDTLYRTLQEIVLVSKKCYLAAAPVLYHKLSLHISSPEELQEHCSRLGPGRINHTRCLKLWGRMPSLPWQDFHQDDEDYPEEYFAQFYNIFSINHSDGPEEESSGAWKPLAMTIGDQFQHISDFIWVCQNQFPPFLLRALEQYHPACRLHIRTFSLRSLRILEGEEDGVEVDNDEAMGGKSPTSNS